MADAAYQAKYLAIARMLWDASEGDVASIPQNYSDCLHHKYSDGDISLVPLLPKFESFSELDDFEIEEAIEILGKVSPEDWPNIEDIQGISVSELLKVYDEDACSFDFVEDNLSTAERVEKALQEIISSVFGAPVTKVRSEKGFFPNPKNNFLQSEDGTFVGQFEYDGHSFVFEVAPLENGWICTYRMHHDSVDKLPPITEEEDPSQTNYTRHVRNRGWK